MLENGLYDLRYRAEGEGAGVAGKGLAILRDGKILGSDPGGGIFTGTCAYDPKARASKVLLRFEVPPGGEMITGYRAGPGGAVIEIASALDEAAFPQSTVVEVAGTPVTVSLTYLGPLPLAAGSVAPERVAGLRRRTAARLRR